MAQNTDAAATLLALGIVDIEYKRVACRYSSKNITFKIDEHSNNPYYLAIVTWYQQGNNDITAVQLCETKNFECKLPYGGAWLWVGSEMIHLMELPNPDPHTGRPEQGGRDHHTCIAIRDVSKLKAILDKAGILFTFSRSGRPAIFTRDPNSDHLLSTATSKMEKIGYPG